MICMRGKEGEGIGVRELQVGVSKVSEHVMQYLWCVQCQNSMPVASKSFCGLRLHLTSRKNRAVFKVDDCTCSSKVLFSQAHLLFIRLFLFFFFAFYCFGFILLLPVICFSNILECQETHLIFTEYPQGGTVEVLLLCRV